MSEHLTDKTALDYAKGSLSSEEFFAVDDHLVSCASCRELLSSLSHVELKLPFLRSQLEAPAMEHLSYPDLESYTDESCDPIDAEIIGSHLQLCGDCASQVTNLKQLRREIASERTSFARKALFRVGAVAAMIGFITLIMLITKSQEPVVASLQDGARVITVTKDGTLHGAEAFPKRYQQLAKAALQQQPVPLPEWLKDIRGHTGTLMGQSSDNPIQLVSPVGIVVESMRPQFEWKALPGASGYSIKVFDSNFHSVLSSNTIQESHWIANSDLQRGSIYTWKVTAFTDHGEVFSPVPPAPEAKFKIVEESNYKDILSLRSMNSHLMLAFAYKEAGMISEAKAELLQLQQQNPNSSQIRKLLEQLQP